MVFSSALHISRHSINHECGIIIIIIAVITIIIIIIIIGYGKQRVNSLPS